MEDLKPLLLKELERCQHTIEKQLQLKRDEMKQLQCNPLWQPILSVIHETPQKGIKTYIEILRGAKTAKMRDNDYHLLSAYGQLSHLSSKALEQHLEDGIQKQWIKRQTFKASFGRYDGLVLTPLGSKTLKANQFSETSESLTPPSISSFSDFLKRLTAGELTDHLIPLLNNLNPLTSEEVTNLIDFILTQRPQYRSHESTFLESIAKAFPPSYEPLLDLNIILSSGVTQKSLKQLKTLLNA